MTNSEISKLLRNMAAALTVLNENAFRIRAYQTAASSIESLTTPLRDFWSNKTLEEVPGIGRSIAEYLDELFRTGGVKHFESTFKKMPEGMFEILGLPEIGAKTAFRLAKELGIKSVADLKKAAESGKIAKLQGFGEKSQEDILRTIGGIQEIGEINKRYLLSQSLEVAEKYVGYLKSSSLVLEAEALGSIRRRAATVGDVDIAVSTNHHADEVDYFVKYEGVGRVESKGDKKASVILKSGEQVDLMTQPPGGFGSLLQHFTGSKEHNIALRELAVKRGLSLSEYGIRKQKGDDLLEFATEEEFYNYLGLDFIPPELRENRGEIEAAQKYQLPNLIDLKDIKGDLHNHTDFIEGENTLEEMIAKAKSLGYSYYAYCDHAPSIENRGIGEIREIVSNRRKLVDEYNRRSPDFKLFLGFEVNITARGEMAWPNDVLSQLDFTIASIHTNHKDPRDKITGRILAALKNPYTSIIGHPSGRLLLDRPSSDIDWQKVFKAAAASGKILEINAHPSRLDLADDLIFEARKYGVKFIISSDAHNAAGQDVMKYGVWMARRGWLCPEDVVNTWGYVDLKKLLGPRVVAPEDDRV